jgi:hypothetical protein
MSTHGAAKLILLRAHPRVASRPSGARRRVETFLWLAVIACSLALAVQLVITLRAADDFLSRLLTRWPWS